FRSGYELFYAAVPAKYRRGIKPILDVVVERLGDVLGGILISMFLLAGPGRAIPLMLALASILGLIGLWISRQLHQGYVKALETNLLNQSIHIDVADIRDSTTRAALMRTLSMRSRSVAPKKSPATPIAEKPKATDTFVQRIIDLRSGDVEVVRRALHE